MPTRISVRIVVAHSRYLEPSMPSPEFLEQLEARIAKYDLLCHPFYEAWSAGELTRDDIRSYAHDYYHHVAEFPSYLAEFAIRLDECEFRDAVRDDFDPLVGDLIDRAQ